LNDELISEILVLFSCNALQLFAANVGKNELVVDGGIVDGNEVVNLEEMEKFIEEIVRILSNQSTEVLPVDVSCVEYASSMTYVGVCASCSSYP
jgi:hypothetical protein